MVYVLMKTLGVRSDKEAARKMTYELLKSSRALEMTAEFGATAAIEVAAFVGAWILGPLGLLGVSPPPARWATIRTRGAR